MAPYGTLTTNTKPEDAGLRAEREAVVVVDPISSGAVLALLVKQWGYVCIAVYSAGFSEELLNLIPKKCKENGLKFDHVVQVGSRSIIDRPCCSSSSSSSSRSNDGKK